MKNIKRIIFVTLIFTILMSCSKENENIKYTDSIITETTEQENIDPIDDPAYYDTDPDCNLIANGYTCCDVDGRKLVRPNYSYSYTFKGIANGNQNVENIVWSVVYGSITIVSGQGTPNAIFKFKSDFINGKIKVKGKIGGCCECTDIIEINKL